MARKGRHKYKELGLQTTKILPVVPSPEEAPWLVPFGDVNGIFIQTRFGRDQIRGRTVQGYRA